MCDSATDDSSDAAPAFMGKSTSNKFSSEDWISDSGATNHFCGDQAWYSELDHSKGDSVINADNGSSQPE
ncbi:unnamed protein product [Allacma fusca]|uniref:Retrovirus-related Pol polyprotein from transposon TNT 1-94-like beta-barrel domain-containing protein n=1 Tax=Allacma fusca TaxID=39272 RepID=A0A8J2PIW5_9HEXA|nr:unnamed protein product [Allacma fusca]